MSLLNLLSLDPTLRLDGFRRLPTRVYTKRKSILGLSRSDTDSSSKDTPRQSVTGGQGPVTVESWLFGLGFQDFVNVFTEYGYDNLDFIVSTR